MQYNLGFLRLKVYGMIRIDMSKIFALIFATG